MIFIFVHFIVTA